MSLVLQLQNYAINDAGTVLTIKDATGTYDADSNPGGFGTPNPARSDIALFLRTYQKRYDGTDDIVNTLLTSTPNDADPKVVESWAVDLLTDSWLQATVYGLPIYSTATLFAVNDLVWKDDSDEIIRIDTVSGSGPYTYTFTVIQEADLENTDYTVAYSTVLNTYAIPSISICLQKANDYYWETEKEKDWKRYLEIQSLIISITYGFAIGAYANSQKKIERVENMCTCLNDECSC